MAVNNTCTWPDGCDKPIMYKKLGLCQNHYMQHRRKEQNEKKEKEGLPVIPPEVLEKMSTARSAEDWQALAAALAPSLSRIMTGHVNASAAQVSLIKDIMNRAYGKPVATQADKKTSIGLVLLPTLGLNENTFTCPKCSFDAIAKLQNDTTRSVAVKVLKELLERLIVEYSSPEMES